MPDLSDYAGQTLGTRTAIIDLAYQILDDRAAKIFLWRADDYLWSEIAYWLGISERHAQRIHTHSLLTLRSHLAPA